MANNKNFNSNIRVECSWEFLIKLTNILVHKAGFLRRRIWYSIRPRTLLILEYAANSKIKNFWNQRKENTLYLGWKIEYDKSLKKFNGAKLISSSLSLDNFVKITPKILKAIKLIGYITRKCTFQIRLFVEPGEINSLKFLTLIDPDIVIKYLIRVKNQEAIQHLLNKVKMIDINSKIELDNFVARAEYILSHQLEDLINDYISRYILNEGTIDLRYTGNFLKKWPEINHTLSTYSHLFQAALDKDYRRDEYYKKILEIFKKESIEG